MWWRRPSCETRRVEAALDDAVRAIGSTLDDGQRAAAKVLAVAGARVTRGRRGRQGRRGARGVYLHGAVGRGKTFLVDTVLGTVPDDDVLRLHAFEAARCIHAAVARMSGTAGAQPLAFASLLDGVRVLFLDELHAHDPGDAMILARLVREAFGRGITLFATSNYPPDGLLPSPLHHHLVLPLVRSIVECCDIVELAPGEDYRRRGDLAGRNGWGAGGWIVPGSPAQAAAMGLATPGPGDRSMVHLSAARLPALGATRTGTGAPNGEVHLDFRELCEGPTSVGDLLDLFDQFRTVAVWRMPRLSETTTDAAQRFANLIDVAWDRDARLVVLAAAVPDDVLDAEFRDRDRIASRLAALPRVY